MKDETNEPDDIPFKIVDMHQRDSEQKHVDMFKGKKVFMDIVPAGESDFKVLFFVEGKVDHPMFGEQEIRHTLTGYYMKRRWFHKMFNMSDEVLIETAVKEAKRRWERVKENTTNFESIREKHGLSNSKLNFD